MAQTLPLRGHPDLTLRDEANAITAQAFRNGFLETLHAGRWSPVLSEPDVSRITDDEIVAVCTRGTSRQKIRVLDLLLPDPPPKGAEWIEAYRRWRRMGE